MTDDTMRDHLDVALAAVLAARILAGQVEAPPLPDDAFDGALGQSGSCQAARVQVREALDDLHGVVDAETWKRVLVLEAAMNAALAEAIEIVWGLGWTAGSSVRGR